MPGDTRGRSRARRETGVEVAAAIPGRATRRRALPAGFRSQRRELPPWTGRSRPPYSSRVPSRSEGRGVVCSPGDLLRLIVGVVAKTRAELALITGRARSTVSQRVDALVQQGWLVEAGEAPSTGGRRPTVWSSTAARGSCCSRTWGRPIRGSRWPTWPGPRSPRRGGDVAVDAGPHEVLEWVNGRFRSMLAEIGRDEAGGPEFAVGRPVHRRQERTGRGPAGEGREPRRAAPGARRRLADRTRVIGRGEPAEPGDLDEQQVRHGDRLVAPVGPVFADGTSTCWPVSARRSTSDRRRSPRGR